MESFEEVLAPSEEGKTFDVELPLASTKDDPEAEYMAKQHFQVEVQPYYQQKQKSQEITEWNAALNTIVSGRLQVVEDYLTTALRFACLEAKLLCFGKNPVHSYLPMHMHYTNTDHLPYICMCTIYIYYLCITDHLPVYVLCITDHLPMYM